MDRKRIVVIAGTRPEAIKMAPLVNALRSSDGAFDVALCSTGQHREMLAQALADFDLLPDIELAVMEPSQTLAGLSGKLFQALDEMFVQQKPDAVLIEGDTTTVQIAALCAFYRQVPIGHVEAGLRSNDLRAPFPEELNRRITSLVASWHFAPTELARANLEKEGIDSRKIFVTGNTVVDALLHISAGLDALPPQLPARIEAVIGRKAPIVLVTGHRRESFGEGFRNICDALHRLARTHAHIVIVYPVHLNPAVREPVLSRLAGLDNVVLEEPMSYRAFVRLMQASRLILTDSGGIQEEAPSLHKPVLIMRDLTERPEGVDAGVNRLVGTSVDSIVAGVEELLFDEGTYRRMSCAKNPYGDGHASERIVSVIRERLR